MSNTNKTPLQTVEGKKTSKKSGLEVPLYWQQLFYRIFTLPNITALLLLAMSLIAWNRGLALLYGMVAALLAFIVLSAIAPWIYLRRLSVTFEPPAPTHANQTQTINFHLCTSKNKAIYGVTLTPTLTGLSSFNDEATDFQSATHTFSCVQGHQYTSIDVTPKRRGCFQLNQLTASCAYPFGLIRFNKIIDTPNCQHIVYPQRINIKQLPPSWLYGATNIGQQSRVGIDGHDLFMGLREYRRGDNYRHIDWRATARSGDIKTREFEQLEQPNVLLVINNYAQLNIGHGQLNALEHSLSLAASIAAYCVAQGISVKTTGAIECRINSDQHLTDFYQQLAELTENSFNHYPEYLSNAFTRTNHGGIIISFVNLQATDTLPEYTSHAHKHWQFIFDDDSYLKPLKNIPKKPVTQNTARVSIPVYANQNIENLINNSH